MRRERRGKVRFGEDVPDDSEDGKEEEDGEGKQSKGKLQKKKKRVSWIECPEDKEREKSEMNVSGSESSDGEWLDPGVLALIDIGIVKCNHRYEIEWAPIDCLPQNPPVACVPVDHEVSVTSKTITIEEEEEDEEEETNSSNQGSSDQGSSNEGSSNQGSSSSSSKQHTKLVFQIQFLVPGAPGKFNFPLGLKFEKKRNFGTEEEEEEEEDKGAISLPIAELRGRAIRGRSGTPFLKKGVICIESPLVDSDDSSDEEGVKTNEFHPISGGEEEFEDDGEYQDHALCFEKDDEMEYSS
mmetsp:Transcript_31491/g.49216  ORF Transcript_31491/g.49216 Transcript_31491/m.49216 type:complete len:297 (-) Transcript_31491:7-897(-)